MTMNRTFKLTAIGSAAVLALGALALPWYSSYTVHAELKALAGQARQGDVELSKLVHEAGLFSSRGSVELSLRSKCAADEDQPPVALNLDYTVNHVPSLTGLNRFEWKATPLGEVGQALGSLLGTGLSGQGSVTYAGLVQTDMGLPEISFARGGESIQVTPSKGRLAVGKTALQFDWLVERAVVRGRGNALEMKQIKLMLDLQNRSMGTGIANFGVDSVSAGMFSLQGFQVSSETTETGGRLNSKITESLRSAEFMGQSLKDMRLEAVVNGLHTPSVQTLTTLFSESCGFQNMTRDEHQQARVAVKALLTSGLSFGITALKGSSQSGGIDGNFLVELQPFKGDKVSLAQQLKSAGQLTVTGTLVTPAQKDLALSTGFVREVPAGLQASYNYAAGLLKVSDKALDAGMFQEALAKADDMINSFLSGERSAAVKPALKEEMVIESEVNPPAEGPVAQKITP